MDAAFEMQGVAEAGPPAGGVRDDDVEEAVVDQGIGQHRSPTADGRCVADADHEDVAAPVDDDLAVDDDLHAVARRTSARDQRPERERGPAESRLPRTRATGRLDPDAEVDRVDDDPTGGVGQEVYGRRVDV